MSFPESLLVGSIGINKTNFNYIQETNFEFPMSKTLSDGTKSKNLNYQSYYLSSFLVRCGDIIDGIAFVYEKRFSSGNPLNSSCGYLGFKIELRKGFEYLYVRASQHSIIISCNDPSEGNDGNKVVLKDVVWNTKNEVQAYIKGKLVVELSMYDFPHPHEIHNVEHQMKGHAKVGTKVSHGFIDSDIVLKFDLQCNATGKIPLYGRLLYPVLSNESIMVDGNANQNMMNGGTSYCVHLDRHEYLVKITGYVDSNWYGHKVIKSLIFETSSNRIVGPFGGKSTNTCRPVCIEKNGYPLTYFEGFSVNLYLRQVQCYYYSNWERIGWLILLKLLHLRKRAVAPNLGKIIQDSKLATVNENGNIFCSNINNFIKLANQISAFKLENIGVRDVVCNVFQLPEDLFSIICQYL